MSEHGLPSGDVTFVFSDIEGSTRLLRQLGSTYRDLLYRHREILRAAWSEHAGHELGTEGDSFLVAFHDPTSAARACVQGQQRLAEAAWPGGVTVRVRMGAHRGAAVPRGSEYVSLAIHQAARVAAAAHGGQVLVTQDARPLDHVPTTSLGHFRIRDFDGPAELFGIATPWTSVDRQPRLVPWVGHNIAVPRGELIAREAELIQLAEVVRPGTLTTISGPGGVGKTRLATEFGRRRAGDFTDGAWLVELGGLTSAELVPAAVAGALGIARDGASPQWPEVLEALRSHQALLILDNCEHLFPDIVPDLSDLPLACPGVAVLATSREPFGLIGESVRRIDPLATDPDDTGSSPAAELFLQRSPIELDASDAPIVEAICASLDGLPLAIEIAAVRTTALPLGDILTAVQQAPTSMVARDPRVPERHRTLTRAFDWSFELLTPNEQLLLETLPVFAGSFDAAAVAAAVADAIDELDVPELLWALVDKSLLVVDERAGATRFRLLGVVRECIDERLEPHRREGARARLVDWYAAQLGPDNANAVSWVGAVGAEIDNLRELFVQPVLADQVQLQRLAWSIARYYDVTTSFTDGITVLDEGLAALPAPTPERVALLTLRADIHLRGKNIVAATASLEEAERLVAGTGPAPWDDAGVARTRGEIQLRSGDHAGAIETANTALRPSLSVRGQARLYNLLGIALGETNELEAAITAFEAELERWEALDLASFIATSHANLAEACLRAHRDVECAGHQLVALDLGRALGRSALEPFTMLVAAQLALRSGDSARAIRLQTAAERALAETGYELYEDDIKAKDDLFSAASVHLCADEIDAAVDAGVHASAQTATAEARQVLEDIIQGVEAR